MIGTLRHRVTIQSETRTADGAGGFTLTWADVATVWGAVEPLKGMERLRAQQIEAPVTHSVTIRHRTDVSTKERIKFGTRLFNIRDVINPDERDRWLELLCEEGVAT